MPVVFLYVGIESAGFITMVFPCSIDLQQLWILLYLTVWPFGIGDACSYCTIKFKVACLWL